MKAFIFDLDGVIVFTDKFKIREHLRKATLRRRQSAEGEQQIAVRLGNVAAQKLNVLLGSKKILGACILVR